MIRAPAEIGSAASSYEILAKLATGGMAEIFLARGASTAGIERYVVLKRVHRHRASDVHFVRMFLDEARLAAQLQHPNIAQVYDIGRLGDSYFFTMEYVHGETVRALLRRSGAVRQPIPIGSVLSIIAGAAAGLHHAHERKGIDGQHLGVVHRDVSPSNLMVSYEGTVKVVDFGIAKASQRIAETQSGTVKGKASYMSPEQCRGDEEIDRRSDLFSLGIVMWEMLTSHKLFRRSGEFETMKAIVTYDPPPPSRLRPEIAPEIDHIVMRLLAKEPAERFQTGNELHEEIEKAAVRTGSALSTASLARYMRELFGERPEPWLELQTQEHHLEAITVTSEPIPDSLELPPEEDLDRRLSEVPALSRRSMSEIDDQALPSVPLPDGDVPTTPFDKEDSLEISTVTAPPPAIARSGAPLQIEAAPSYPVVTSLADSAFASSTSYSVVPHPSESARSRSLVILGIALAIGAVIGIAFAIGGRGSERSQIAQPPLASTTSAASAMEASDANDPPPSDPEPATVTEPAPTEPVIAVPSDPEPTAAAEPVLPAPTDTEPAPATEPTADALVAPAPTSDAPPVAAPERDVPTAYREGAYDEVLARCSSSRRELDAHAVPCTLAACKARQVAKAQRWFSKVPASKRRSVAEACDGVLAVKKRSEKRPDKPVEKPADKPTEKRTDKPVDRPSREDECKRDPMACQY